LAKVKLMLIRTLRTVLFWGGLLYAGYFLSQNHDVLIAHPPVAKHAPAQTSGALPPA